jgi:recombination protein RecA
MTGVSELIGKFKEKYGEFVGQQGDEIKDTTRIPTGIFPLDLILGGGIPEGRVTELCGTPGSCKSNIMMMVLAQKQKRDPHLTNVIVDIENSFDPIWAKRLGLDPSKVTILKPDYGEQAVDMIEALLHEPEIGVVVLDSMAAMITGKETDASAEKEFMAPQSKLNKTLINKVTTALRQAEDNGAKPTFLYINQIRTKLGVMFGDPTGTPGGWSPEFACSLRVRFWPKDIIDKKYSVSHAARKQLRAVVIKHKVPIVARECIFEMAMIPHAGMRPGDVEVLSTLWTYMVLHGIVTGDTKAGWEFMGEKYKTQKALRERIEGDPELLEMTKKSLITNELDRAYNLEHVGEK